MDKARKEKLETMVNNLERKIRHLNRMDKAGSFLTTMASNYAKKKTREGIDMNDYMYNVQSSRNDMYYRQDDTIARIEDRVYRLSEEELKYMLTKATDDTLIKIIEQALWSY